MDYNTIWQGLQEPTNTTENTDSHTVSLISNLTELSPPILKSIARQQIEALLDEIIPIADIMSDIADHIESEDHRFNHDDWSTINTNISKMHEKILQFDTILQKYIKDPKE